MDAKVTLSFNEEVIGKAKQFAEKNNISLSRLTEFLLRQITTGEYKSLDELPVADWVNQVAEGKAEYHTKSRKRKDMKAEYLASKK
ncbi:hypothetical protein GCM10011506_00480 [Marivirga lumbricoides]|uniref:Uncharacterized protein n=1 Tax=Marivirga lumbricoides TaxID=1046115 RepID=A0A2T4DUA5_9BACT|nr:hypothetical protein C9994_02880 [Marivirga lumbricoides]GGC19322.1 hypothetical protein GCM10011506_00480 [Marivirga lumbricoides]